MISLSARIQDWLTRDRDRAFLGGLPDPAWQDLGFTKTEGLELTEARADVRERMLAMAAHYGLEAEDIDCDRQGALDIAFACGRCRSTGICTRYLAGIENVEPDTFCPNAAKYAELSGAA